MFSRVVSLALLSLFGAGFAQAQGTLEVAAPTEQPPASYLAQQYVDSRGCVFMRAGIGGATTWVPRMSSERKALCGYPPSMAAGDIVQLSASTETVKAMTAPPASKQRTRRTKASKHRNMPVRVATPVAAAPATCPPDAPYRGSFTARNTGEVLGICSSDSTRGVLVKTVPIVARAPLATCSAGQAAKVGCPAMSPIPKWFPTTSGDALVLCTRPGSGLDGLRLPVLPSGVSHARACSTAMPPILAGYQRAWQDDRLNPQRAIGTAEGQAAQDRKWTREVPATMTAPKVRPIKAAPASVATVSPTAAVYVQVGTFGEPANAAGVKAHLRGIGLPVARAEVSQGGRALQIVFAGPFGGAAQARAALAAARGAGFADAFIR